MRGRENVDFAILNSLLNFSIQRSLRAHQFIDIDSGTLFALESIFQFKDALAQGAPFVREEGEEIFCSNETFSFPFCYETLEQREEGRRNVFHRG